MNRLLVVAGLLFANLFFGNNLFSDEIDPSAQLSLASTEATSTALIDTNLLAQICALQLRIGDFDSAQTTLRHILSNSADSGSYGGPLEKLTILAKKQLGREKFEELIAFFHRSKLGTDPDRKSTNTIDRMIVNMVAKAASEKDYQLAQSLLKRLSDPPTTCRAKSSEHNTIQAALWLNIVLIQEDNDIDAALKIAAIFDDDVARTFVCRDIYELSLFSHEAESKINDFLDGVSAEAEIDWCRARLNVAIGNPSALWDKDRKERADGSKAAKMLRRMVKLGLKDQNYLFPLVARQLEAEGKTLDALEFLEIGNKADGLKRTEKPSFTTELLSEEFGKAGEIDKAIELSAHWNRNDVRFRSNRLSTYSQPLCEIATKLARPGSLDEAIRVAESIEDNYWRTVTINNVGRAFLPKNKATWLEYSRRAELEAEKITPLEDRQSALRQIIGPRVDYLDMTFDDVIAAIEPLSNRGKSSILGSKMESLLDEQMPLEQIRQAIAIIESGNTMDLHMTAEKLLERGEEDLAVDTILKIELEYEFEFYLHDFFEKVREDWPLKKQLAFISKAQKSERPELIFTVFKNATEPERTTLRPIALKILADSESGLTFHMQLMQALFDDFLDCRRFDLLEQLMDIPLEEDFQIRELGSRVESASAGLLNSNMSHVMDSFEASLNPPWCRLAVTKARIKADIGDDDFENALKQIDGLAIQERGAMRVLLIDSWLANESH